MPKLSVSVPFEQYDFLKAIDPSISKAVQIVIAEAMQLRGWVYVPGHWEKK